MSSGGKFSVGIHGLIEKGGKFLVVQRSRTDTHEPLSWDLPGGGVEFGEHPYDSFVREAKEELGLSVKITGLKAVYTFYDDPETWSVQLAVEAEYLEGRVKLSFEHSDYKWVSEKDLHLLDPKSVHLKAALKP